MALLDTPKKIRSIWPPLLLLALSVIYTVWAQDYGDVPRLMPTVVGVATSLLCVLDLLSRMDNRLGLAIRASLGADFRNREMTHDPKLRHELIQVGWMVGCIAAILLIGILPTVPLFIIGYMLLWGRQPLMITLITAVTVLVFVVVVFEVLLDYRLYRGVLFGAEGFGLF